MDTKNVQHKRIEHDGVEGETKKLTILVVFMSTIVLALYGIIPFI